MTMLPHRDAPPLHWPRHAPHPEPTAEPVVCSNCAHTVRKPCEEETTSGMCLRCLNGGAPPPTVLAPDPDEQAKAERYRALLAPYLATLNTDSREIGRHYGLGKAAMRVVVPSDWPAAFDGAQVLGMDCTRAARGNDLAMNGPIVAVKPEASVPPPILRNGDTLTMRSLHTYRPDGTVTTEPLETTVTLHGVGISDATGRVTLHPYPPEPEPEAATGDADAQARAELNALFTERGVGPEEATDADTLWAVLNAATPDTREWLLDQWCNNGVRCFLQNHDRVIRHWQGEATRLRAEVHALERPHRCVASGLSVASCRDSDLCDCFGGQTPMQRVMDAERDALAQRERAEKAEAKIERMREADLAPPGWGWDPGQ